MVDWEDILKMFWNDDPFMFFDRSDKLRSQDFDPAIRLMRSADPISEFLGMTDKALGLGSMQLQKSLINERRQMIDDWSRNTGLSTSQIKYPTVRGYSSRALDIQSGQSFGDFAAGLSRWLP